MARRNFAIVSSFRMNRPDTDQVVWLEERTLVLQDEHRQVVLVTGIATGVTEQRTAREALRVSNEALGASNAELATASARLQERALELELSNQQLQNQTVELDQQTEPLQAIALARVRPAMRR